MATPGLPDPTQQIDPTDPKVAAVIAAIKQKLQPIDTSTPQLTNQVAPTPAPTLPPPTQNVAPQNIPPPALPPMQGSPMPQMTQPAPADPSLAPMQSSTPQMTPPAVQDVNQKPGPVKSFLQSLVSGLGQTAYAGTQGALQKLGIPTDYEKQQNALKIGLQQQQQDSLEGLRQSQQNLYSGKLDQLQSQLTPTQIPNDPKYGAFAGTTMPLSAASAVMQKMESLQNAKDIASGKNATTLEGKQIQYGPDSYLRHEFKSISGRDVEVDKGTGQIIKDFGPSNSIVTGLSTANARAAANARYRTFDTVDANGNPVTISGLDALTGGAAHTPYAQAKGIASDKVGIQQYDQILGRISQNLPVLNDNTQRAAIAHTLAEADKNPGMLQAIITSGLQSNALTPAGAQLTADIMQGREFGGVARKYGGNMNGTEGLMNRIMANQASPLNSEQLNRDLVANDQAFTKKANTVVSGLSAHNAGNRGGPPNIAPQASTGTVAPEGTVVHMQDGSTQVKRGGVWVPQ